MRAKTMVWAKFESKGYPQKTMRLNGTVNAMVFALAKWITSEGVYLNTGINITITRTEAELDLARANGVETFESELEALMNGESDEPA